MKKSIYTIKDELSNVFGALIDIENDMMAKRYFNLMIENTPLMKANPTDFSIWKVGTFDTESGINTGAAVPELIERGKVINE